MLNVSVPTRLPFMKMPKLPESATLAPPFSFSLDFAAGLSAALRETDVASTAPRRMASFTAFTFLPPLFWFNFPVFWFLFQSASFQQLFNFCCDLLNRFIERLHGESGQSVVSAAGRKQLVKSCILLRQRTHLVLCLAAPPQFLYWRFQKHGDRADGVERVTIGLLHKRSATEGQYKIAAVLAFLQQSRKCSALHLSKSGFTGRSKYLSHASALTLFDHVVQIQKLTAHAPGQRTPYSGLARAHKPDENYALHSVA